jgi:uncharacterized RDD family membrane protein YckC
MNADNLKRRSVAKGIPFLLLGVIIIIAVAVYVILNPGILNDLTNLVVIVVMAILAIVVIVFAVMMILAIPFYFLKGEQYQDGGSYGLDDVKAVRESSSEDKDRKE